MGGERKEGWRVVRARCSPGSRRRMPQWSVTTREAEAAKEGRQPAMASEQREGGQVPERERQEKAVSLLLLPQQQESKSKKKYAQQACTPPLCLPPRHLPPPPPKHTHSGGHTAKQRGRWRGTQPPAQPHVSSVAWAPWSPGQGSLGTREEGVSLGSPPSFFSPPIRRSRLLHPQRPWAEGLAPPASSPRPLLSAA